jgi:hypothetical protein
MYNLDVIIVLVELDQYILILYYILPTKFKMKKSETRLRERVISEERGMTRESETRLRERASSNKDGDERERDNIVREGKFKFFFNKNQIVSCQIMIMIQHSQKKHKLFRVQHLSCITLVYICLY